MRDKHKICWEKKKKPICLICPQSWPCGENVSRNRMALLSRCWTQQVSPTQSVSCASISCTVLTPLCARQSFSFHYTNARWELEVKWKSLSRVRLFATPWTVHGILQARILEYSSPFPGDLPNPGIEPRSPTLQADSFLKKLFIF